MDCTAYCTASTYHIKPLFEVLKHRYKTTQARDVIHAEIPHLGVTGDLFIFPYGACVFWGISKDKVQDLLGDIRSYEGEHTEGIEMDEFTYSYGDLSKVFNDEIILPDKDVLTKLAISNGIAQSVKLNTFETAILKTFSSTRSIPNGLAKQGKISLSRSEIRKKMGELFIERSTIHLHLDALDLPEFFWEYPELEPLYRSMANHLDVQTRVEVLNKRLNILHELFEMLGTELNHQHSSRLELTIILLIIIEVVLSLLRDVFQVI
jgi:uncharacterized Rmd1/YagE family protein